MLDFIIFEENETLKNNLKANIYKVFGAINREFKIYDYNLYKSSFNKKIYILSSSSFNKVINISKDIRNSGDYYSPIIIISNLKNKELNNELLILSYIDKNDVSNCKIRKALNCAYNIIINNDTYTISFNGIVHKIPLNEILFIEKESYSNKSIIHTSCGSYEVCSTIKEIEKDLNNVNFLKVHRSCIININNVVKYDFVDNTIYFDNISTNLVSRDMKNILKEKLLDD